MKKPFLTLILPILFFTGVSAQNLINSNDWIAGTVGATTNYSLLGTNAQNSRIEMPGPYGNTVTVWRGSADGATGMNGGFSHNGVTMNTNTAYRVTFWMRAGANACTNFSGFTPYEVGGPLVQPFLREDGSNVSWPYFSSVNLPDDKWYLIVGYLRPGSMADNGDSGVYDPSSGTSTSLPSPSFGASDFIFPANMSQINIRIRTFMWACASGDMFVYDPRIEEVSNMTPLATLLYGDSVADTSPPTSPTLSMTGNTDTSVSLSWSGATDNNGVTGYKVYSNGVLQATLGTVNSYTVTGLAASSSYSFSVSSLDGAGNESSPSNSISVTTNSGGGTQTGNKLNLSGMVTEQSTTYFSSVASLAIDGDKTGSGSSLVTHTLEEEDSWWRIDLGAVYDLTRIDIFNRTNCCNERLDGTKVYVGTTDSYSPLDYTQVGSTLTGSLSVQQLDFSASGRYILVSQHDIVGPRILSLAEVEAYGTLSTGNNGGTTGTGGTSPWVLGLNDNIYFNSGNVGIGISDPGTDKLAVNGNIRAKEVKVEIVNWPDYVFEAAYQLPTLEEVKKYIDEKGHLPKIPSAEEIQANGLEVGEVNKLLLEKIEELFLYLLQQEERIKELENKTR